MSRALSKGNETHPLSQQRNAYAVTAAIRSHCHSTRDGVTLATEKITAASCARRTGQESRTFLPHDHSLSGSVHSGQGSECITDANIRVTWTLYRYIENSRTQTWEVSSVFWRQKILCANKDFCYFCKYLCSDHYIATSNLKIWMSYQI